MVDARVASDADAVVVAVRVVAMVAMVVVVAAVVVHETTQDIGDA